MVLPLFDFLRRYWGVFSYDEEATMTTAASCFDAMGRFSPNKRSNKTPNNHKLKIDRLGKSDYTFRARTYSLMVS